MEKRKSTTTIINIITIISIFSTSISSPSANNNTNAWKYNKNKMH